MKYKIAIPSFRRIDKIQTHTLKMLRECNIKDKEIYIFLADKQDYDLYKKEINGDYNFILGVPTLHNQRNFMTDFFDNEEKILYIDDDIKELTKLENGKAIKYNDINTIVKLGFENCIENDLFIWGIYPVDNGYFMKDKITTDLKYIIGCFYGVINRHNIDLQVHLEDKEDFLRTLLYYDKDGGVVRLNNIGVKTEYFGDGGMNIDIEKRLKEGKRNCELIRQLFPDWVSIQIKVGKLKRPYYNLRLHSHKKKKKELYYFINDLHSDCFILFDYLKNLRITANGNRKHINKGKHPLSTTYGYVRNGNNNGIWRPKSLLYNGWYISKMKQDYPYLEDIFREFTKLYFKDLRWTNIMINKNFETQPHRDANNIGISGIIGLGDYTGGELHVEGLGNKNIWHSPLVFNGSELTHYTLPFKGERWSLVFFNNIT